MQKRHVKEIYYTLQGEGANTGRPAVFVRFTGCNLWTGREKDRHKAICKFCDTDFLGTDGPGGGVYTINQLVEKIMHIWPAHNGQQPFVVLTGGEPLLQVTEECLEAMHKRGIFVAVETNGTIQAPQGIDWICVSPKADAPLVQDSGHELKLVYPQTGLEPGQFEGLQFDHFYLQPMDGPDLAKNTQMAVRFCLANPKWKLSIQTHKILALP